MKKGSFFWVGLSDLMTSLFFIMLVLCVITFVKLEVRRGRMVKDLQKLDEIENVEKVLSSLDPSYYIFDEVNKRYKLKIDAKFPPNSSDINALEKVVRDSILVAGRKLYEKIESLTASNEDIEYLIIIEGNTQRYMNNFIYGPDVGYRLSYDRALALFNFWKENSINFYRLNGQCEVMIAGSGYFGQSRENDEAKNKRFSIQVTSKVGKFLNKRNSVVKAHSAEIMEVTK
jgi:tetrahydromethanopterin S-methyltransferase subunit B